MLKGIIYFIQPSELVGTNRYKIGCSKSPDLERCNKGYKKGSRYIYIMECNNPLILEKNIKDEFNKLFKLIAGNEYFEGNEYIMKKTFLKIVEEYEKSNIKITDSDNNRSTLEFNYDTNKFKAVNTNEYLDDLCNFTLKSMSNVLKKNNLLESESDINQFEKYVYNTKLFSNLYEQLKNKISYIFINNNDLNLSKDTISQYKYFEQNTKFKSDLREEIKDKIENIAYIFTLNNESDLDT